MWPKEISNLEEKCGLLKRKGRRLGLPFRAIAGNCGRASYREEAGRDAREPHAGCVRSYGAIFVAGSLQPLWPTAQTRNQERVPLVNASIVVLDFVDVPAVGPVGWGVWIGAALD
jgi:hypothetical protein